jgi:DNA-binding FadR family transcriptional regulator
MPLTSIEPRRLYRQIAEQIRGLIMSGEYAVGARLPPERDLAKQLRVSRPSVREALIALEVEGLVEVRVGSGIYVHALAAGMSAARAGNGGHLAGPFDLIRARKAIEGECAALAAKVGKRPQLAQIAEALQQMEEDAQKMAQPLEADRLFHLRVAEATNNVALVHVVKNLWEERGGPLFTQLQHHFNTPRSWSSAIREHAAVLEAIRSHDPDQARATMHHHMEQAAKRFSKSWDGR